MMENSKNLNDLLRNAFSAERSGITPPPVTEMKGRKNLERPKEPERDFFALLAGFLNMKVRLYHAAIAFFVIWISILMFSDNDSPRARERAEETYSSNIAAAHNHSTVPSCIQTFVLRK